VRKKVLEVKIVMAQEEFLLKWNDHHTSFFNIVEELCRSEQLCDVTLACGGQVFETHKLILSVCSPFFRALLNRADRHPIVYLKDVNPGHLQLLLNYMYKGEINVLQHDLGPLIETAKGLQIKGLADAGDEEKPVENGDTPPQQQQHAPHPPQPSPQPPRIQQRPNPPPAKRIRPATPPTLAPVLKAAKKIVENPASCPVVLPKHPVSRPGSGASDNSNNSQPMPGLVKMETEETGQGWTGGIEELGIQRQNQEKETYEQELQQEDEQYIQPEGLSQQQITMLQREIQKKYPCEFCHKRFPTPSKLNRHKLVHSGEKPYLCNLCKKGFTQKVHLNTHMKLSHPTFDPASGQEILIGQVGGGLEDGEIPLHGLHYSDAKTGQISITNDLKPVINTEDDLGVSEVGSDSENQLYINMEGVVE